MIGTWKEAIKSDPTILRGKPCFKGTRIPVALVLGYLAASRSREEILHEFPDLNPTDISAALEYAASAHSRRRRRDFPLDAPRILDLRNTQIIRRLQI